MKQILFPTDFSDNSNQAFPYALDLAYLLDAELTLFNSYKMPHSKSNLLVSMTDRMRQDSIDELEKMKTQAISNEKYKNLNIKIEVRVGGFVSQIPKIATNCNTNLIVMGTKGASGIKEMVIGSNTLEVIQTSHCPVLAVPEKAQNAKVDKIAMAVDLKKIKDPEQLSPLLQMAEICRASIEFVHVMHPDETSSTEDRFKEIMLLENMASEIPSNINIITDTDIIQGLSRYMEKGKPGMLAMLSRKHSLFERLFTSSITNKLSFRSEIPLLIMDE